MGNIFEGTTQNRLFLIYGNLGDLYCTENLIPTDVKVYFDYYFKSIGFKNVIYYDVVKGEYSAEPDENAPVEDTNTKSKRRKSPGFSVVKTSDENEKTEEPADKQENNKQEKVNDTIILRKRITPESFFSDVTKWMGESDKSVILVDGIIEFFSQKIGAPFLRYINELKRSKIGNGSILVFF